MQETQPSCSTYYQVQVSSRSPELDGSGRDVLAEVRQLPISDVEAVHTSKLYFFRGVLSAEAVQTLAALLLCDPVAEVSTFAAGLTYREDARAAVEVHAKPGVMDPVALSTRQAAMRVLRERFPEARIDEVRTARRYVIVGASSAGDLERIAKQVLANSCIQHAFITGFGRNDELPATFVEPPELPFELRRVKLVDLSDAELEKLSREAHLFLSLKEMQAIRDHFADLDRDPTDLELETLAQTWSEHCVHKTLKSEVEYRGDDFGKPGTTTRHYGNLLKDTIAYATRTLDKDWCLSVFEDNAGVIAFDEEYGLAFKVETHNHPSAIEPYGGAATGIGGCIRDIMGCGLGAKPIASTDIFCFAPPDFDRMHLPKDVLHPRRVMKGVVRGVRDYGNRMGIPTVNGAIYFDERYLGNPLVFCGCAGLIPRNRIAKKAQVGDRIVVAGGRTGRDGIHGATFSSAELTDSHADEFSHAVQIGNAIEEKKLLDAQLIARDHETGCLYSAVTDCGAGGLSSAVGEMGASTGANVDLDSVPLKYAGLRYDEIWISEAQERMVFAVPPENLETFLAIFTAEEVEATVIGTFADDKMLTVRYRRETVGMLDMDFLHEGYPRQRRLANWTQKVKKPAPGGLESPGLLTDRLLLELGEYNTASKEWVIRQYDHEVQGRSVIKPLSGPNAGPSDAAVLRPVYDRVGGVVLGCGLCPEFTRFDPYWMAVFAVDEALRNVICVGGDPKRTAILDNFCWGKTDKPEAMGELVRAAQGAADAAIAFGLPFISGKDSLNNEFALDEDEAKRLGVPARIAIPGTLLISAMSIMEDVEKSVSMDLKSAGNALVVGSSPVDRVGLEAACSLHAQVAELIVAGKVKAAHDISDGGLAVAVAEMCIASGLGASLDVDGVNWDDSLFENLPTSYILEMAESDARRAGLPIVGWVEDSGRLVVKIRGRESINASTARLDEAWRTPLAFEGGR